MVEPYMRLILSPDSSWGRICAHALTHQGSKAFHALAEVFQLGHCDHLRPSRQTDQSSNRTLRKLRFQATVGRITRAAQTLSSKMLRLIAGRSQGAPNGTLLAVHRLEEEIGIIGYRLMKHVGRSGSIPLDP
ncbi:hypothetical protein XI04_08255 [Bradyrhizobium sp. CCBAU 11430]|nr:hypothetical protein [Bradyrhizobium sp. CCBAU 11430]